MKAVKLATYILKNDLSENQLVKIIKDLIRETFQFGYRRGYWTRDVDVKRIRKAKENRIKQEHEAKELNQDK